MAQEAGIPSARKPHWIAILATTFVAATLIVANLDGYHNHLFGAQTTITDDPRSALFNWAHGWPWAFMVRHSIYPLSGIYTATGFTGPHGFHSRWPVDDAPVLILGLKPILFDCMCWVVLVFGTAYGTQRLACWWNPRNSFGLKTLFVATGVVAVGTHFGPLLFEDESRYLLYNTTLCIAGAAAVLTLFSFADFMYHILRWLRRNEASLTR